MRVRRGFLSGSQILPVILAVGSLSLLILGISGCSSKLKPTTTATTTSSSPTVAATMVPASTSPSATKTLAPTSTASATKFPFQGSGSGTWSGQLTINNRNYPVSGTMTVAVDANGTLTGAIADSRGATAPTNITAKVESNGNLTGTVSFTISGITFSTNWQGKMSVSGNNLSLQGTWTSQYGSGTFSGSGAGSM